MITSFSDPFEALFTLQRALEASSASDWMGSSTTGTGSYPAINIFKQGDDFVAVFELPGINKNDFQLEAKGNTIRISGKKAIEYGEGVSVHRRERVLVCSTVLCRFRSNRPGWHPCGIQQRRTSAFHS
jgi:HSP20 family protein